MGFDFQLLGVQSLGAAMFFLSFFLVRAQAVLAAISAICRNI